MNSEPVRSLEWLAYGFGQTVTPARIANENIAVVAIDDASLEALGKWPWSRDQLAAMIRQLRKADARVIGITIDGLDVPQNELGLELLGEFREQNRSPSAAADTLLDRVMQQLNTDQSLASELSATRNIFLSVPFTPVRRQPEKTPALSPLLEQYAIKDVQGKLPEFYGWLPEWLHPDQYIYAAHLQTPAPLVARSVDGLGLSAGPPVVDGSTGGRPMVVPYLNQYLPSFPLLVAAAYSKQSKKIQLAYGSGISIGSTLSIPTDNKFRALPFYYQQKTEAPFRVFSFHKVLNGEISAKLFADKIVLLGPTSPQLVEPLITPIGEKMAPVLIEAHTVSSLLNGDMYTVPRWAHWVRYIAFLIVGIYLMYFLPRLSIGSALAITALQLVIMLNVHFILMAFQALWLPLMAPAAALLAGHFLLGGKRLLLRRVTESQHELAKSNRLLGQAYHAQGQLDMAFEKYRLSTVDEELLSLTYNLGLDYERKRQFNKAVNVFRFIRTQKGNYRDTKDRIHKNLQTSNEVVLGNSRNDLDKTLVLSKTGGMQKPMLGRYQIESELGKGAMGTVYLGTDPKIGRTVAIKTMPLSSEFEDEMLEEVKSRFFREAETAGRLHHNNIVTIYDVGEEHDLAYIAMDFLQGMDMSKFTKKEKLLRVDEVFNVIIQVADALHYAHEQNVVHRDIKPANIIFDRRAKKPTVTDFGVAHITDNTKTKTGTILGTPSFMAPEQLAGTSVDGRSDLFSLGVTFFQLLTGELPFVAESISSLMFKIANEEPRDVLKLRPDLPICVKAIINKSLQKDPEKRYQTGDEFIKAMKRCEKNINGK